MRTLRLDNESERPLRVYIEPRTAHCEVAPNTCVDMNGFDPAEEVLDAIVQIDADGPKVTFRSSNQIVFFVAERFSPPYRGPLWRIGEYLQQQLETSRTTTMRIENKTG